MSLQRRIIDTTVHYHLERMCVCREKPACALTYSCKAACASHPERLLVALLGLASIHQSLPEFGRDTGNVEGAGNGRGVKRSKVGGGQSGPPRGLEVDNNKFLFQQHHQCRRLIKL